MMAGGLGPLATNLYNALRTYVPANPPLLVSLAATNKIRLQGTAVDVTTVGGWASVSTTNVITRQVKLSEMTNSAAVIGDTLVMVTTNPAGVPASRSITVSNLDKSMRAMGTAKLTTTNLTINTPDDPTKRGRMTYVELPQFTIGHWDTFFLDGMALTNVYFYDPLTSVMRGMISMRANGEFIFSDEDGHGSDMQHTFLAWWQLGIRF